MSVEEQSLACPHLKYLPKEQRPGIRGTIAPPCKHKTPRYYLGWSILVKDIHKVYPKTPRGVVEFWRTEIHEPWVESYGKKYRNNTQGSYCNPCIIFLDLDKAKPDELYMVIHISHNRNEEGIAFSENQEFIDDMRRMTYIDESIAGELKWI
ncbi:hypothetical protein BDP27DRAFT_1333456, partial [Rhodocollybia butyracea]